MCDWDDAVGEGTLDEQEDMYYTVVRIEDGEVVHRGTCVSSAAEALQPGCVYGKGKTQAGATRSANTIARKIKWRRKQRAMTPRKVR